MDFNAATNCMYKNNSAIEGYNNAGERCTYRNIRWEQQAALSLDHEIA